MPLRHLILVATMAWTLLSGPGFADDKLTAARAKFHDGIKAFEDENYPAALAAFEESYRLNPKPRVLYNIANCSRGLYKFADAIAAFELFLAEAQGSLPELQAEAEQQLVELRRLVGTLDIAEAPDGASVVVNAKPVGTTPLPKPLILDPGHYRIQVSATGYEPMSSFVNISAEAGVTLRAKLQPALASLEVDCSGKALVQLDGRVVGGCPWSGKVKPGEHRVLVEMPGMVPFEQVVTVKAGSTFTLAAPLSKAVLSDPLAANMDARTPQLDSAFSSRSKAMRIAGWASGALGLAATGVGIGFLGAYNNDIRTANAANDRYSLETGTEQDRQDRNSAVEDSKTPEAGMIAGFVTGGAFLIAGAVLLGIGYGKREERSVAISSNGLLIRF